MKRIGLLISTLDSGGAERVVSRLSKILSERYEVYLILFEGTYIKYEYYGELIDLNVKSSKFFLKKLILPFLRSRRLKKVKKEKKLDVVISFLDSPNIVNIISKIKECKTIVSIRNYTIKEEKQNIETRLLSKVIGRLYKKSDGIIATSELIRKSIIQKYNVEEKLIETIYNPYDKEEIMELAKQDIDEEYKIFFNSQKVFITVGRMMYQKGFWHLIKAFKIVNEYDREAKLAIIGTGYQEEKIKRLINDLEINKSVILLGYQKNPFKYMKNSKIYVMTSLFEGFPNALAEAMNCGLPIISTDCKSGPREILDGTENIEKSIEDLEYSKYGILVPELSDVENWNKDELENEERILARAMIELLHNEKLCLKYKEQSAVRVEKFSYENCKLKYYELLRKIIGE